MVPPGIWSSLMAILEPDTTITDRLFGAPLRAAEVVRDPTLELCSRRSEDGASSLLPDDARALIAALPQAGRNGFQES